MCIALATRNILPDDITAQKATSGILYSCKSNHEDEIGTALQTMAERRIRRLPVLDATGKLAGVFSVEKPCCTLIREPAGPFLQRTSCAF